MAMMRTGTVERAYVDTISLRDPTVVARYVAVVALLTISLLLTAHWAGSPRAALDAGAAPTAVVTESSPAFGAGDDGVAGVAR
jgi:hypothetical protein